MRQAPTFSRCCKLHRVILCFRAANIPQIRQGVGAAQSLHLDSQSWSCTPLQTLLIHQTSLDVSSVQSQCKKANTQTSMADHFVGDVGIRFIRIWLPKRSMPERHFLATNQARLGAVVGQDLPLIRGALLRAVAPK